MNSQIQDPKVMRTDYAVSAVNFKCVHMDQERFHLRQNEVRELYKFRKLQWPCITGHGKGLLSRKKVWTFEGGV